MMFHEKVSRCFTELFHALRCSDLTSTNRKDYLPAMRSPRYSPPQTRQNGLGRVLALPSDSHELFRRDLRQSLERAAAAHAIPSAYTRITNAEFHAGVAEVLQNARFPSGINREFREDFA